MRRALILLLLIFLLPAAVHPQQNKKHSVTLKWNAPIAGERVVGYNIYRSDKENGHYGLIAKRVKALTYVDTAVQSGHTYYYKVTSRDAKGRESTAATTKAAVP